MKERVHNFLLVILGIVMFFGWMIASSYIWPQKSYHPDYENGPAGDPYECASPQPW